MAERTKSAKGDKCKSSLISRIIKLPHMVLSSNWSRTAALQAANPGSSPGRITTGRNFSKTKPLPTTEGVGIQSHRDHKGLSGKEAVRY